MLSTNTAVASVLLIHLAAWPSLAAGQPANATTAIDSLWDGQLVNISSRWAPTSDPNLGGLRMGYCCRLAIRESLEVVNGSIEFVPGQSHLAGTVEDVLKNPFPCSFKYSGTGPGYAPQVWISYPYCATNCPGWQMTRPTVPALSQWLQPLILFVLPAAVFSLGIPRARRINVPRLLFPRRFLTLPALLSLIVKIPAAALLVTLDMALWTMFSVTFAGPMILSATYEAILDRRLINFLRRRMAKNSLSIRQRAHLLAVIVFGSIEDEGAWGTSVALLGRLPGENLRRRMSSSVRSDPGALVVSPLLSHASSGVQAPSNSVPTLATSTFSSYTNGNMNTKRQVPVGCLDHEKQSIEATKATLLASLESQSSFGSVAGAPVVFYCGNFAYTLIELNSNYGDVSVAHFLAFGMAWTVIPHIAIVCGMLLGCKSPFLWESAIAALSSSSSRPVPSPSLPLRQESSFPWRKIYTPYFESRSRCAWVWNRGVQKRAWIRRYAETYKPLGPSIQTHILAGGIGRFAIVALPPSIVLISVPAFLGAMISYTTPAVGLSCRSMTLLVYACSQSALVLLWTVKMFYEPQQPNLASPPPTTITNGRAKTKALSLSLLPRGHHQNQNQILRRALDRVGTVTWHAAFSANLLFSFFSGIMGTIFLFMNLYINCLCAFPAKYWPTRWTNPEARIYMSGVSYEQIGNAATYWIPAGIGAICCLVSMAWLGWWYSRLMKTQFRECVEAMDAIDTEDRDENENEV